MKICYLSDADSYHTKKWCKFFAQSGHDVHIISFTKANIKEVKVHYINSLADRHSNRISKLGYIFSLNKIRHIINDIQPDILHAHRATGYSFLGSLIKFNPFIISVWGSDVYEFPNRSILHKKFIKYVLNKPDYIFSTSNSMKKRVKQFTNKNCLITPFGVDLNVFKPNNQGPLNNEIIIGTVKTLEKKYGIKYLINAFAKIKKMYKNKNIKLIIAGDGSERNKLEKLTKDLNINDKVDFLGFIKQKQVVKVFNHMDIAVFPSIYDSESFGVAAVEAQACKTAVIASNVGGLPEATNPNYSSLIVPPKDVKALVNALSHLIDDPEKRKQMAENGLDYVKRNYNINDNFKEVENFYYSII